MHAHDRRGFFKRAAGFLALAAVAKLPVIPEPERWCPECGRTLPEGEAVCSLCDIGEPEVIDTFMNGEREGVVTFRVFGRNTMYALPGVRR